MKRSLILCGALAGLLAVGLAFGCQVGESGPEKVTKKFFAAIEKGDLMSLHEYADADTVKYVGWLEQGGASRAASAGASAGGALLGGLVGGLFGSATAGAVVGSAAGGGVSNEEARHLMCKSGLIARGRVVSMEEAIKTEFTMAGEDVPQLIAGPKAPAGAEPNTKTFAVVTAKFQGGASEKIALAKAEADGKWKVSSNLTNYWNNTIVANHGDEGFSFGSSGAKAHDVYVVTEDKTYKNRSVLYNNGGHSIYVSGNDVYVGGWDGKFPTLWKNGVAQRFSGAPCSVFVSGGDVYVAGYAQYPESRLWSGSVTSATLWKNGVAQRLSDRSSSAFSVFVSGGDVYVAGQDTQKNPNNDEWLPLSSDFPTLWKNGVAQVLEYSGNHLTATSVFVDGGDVYVAGSDNNYGWLWKNGVRQHLGTSKAPATRINSVFVSSGDVYAAGKQDKKDTLGENGVAQQLGGIDSEAYSVFVAGGDVYVAGYVDGTDFFWLWKNGVGQRYGKGENRYDSDLVFVK
jgi:hypothetical protein